MLLKAKEKNLASKQLLKNATQYRGGCVWLTWRPFLDLAANGFQVLSE